MRPWADLGLLVPEFSKGRLPSWLYTGKRNKLWTRRGGGGGNKLCTRTIFRSWPKPKDGQGGIENLLPTPPRSNSRALHTVWKSRIHIFSVTKDYNKGR